MAACTIIAGPNGSGKSTVLLKLRPAGETINTDDVARRLNPERPEAASMQAGRAVVARINEVISSHSDFNFETTLSSSQSLAVMRKARDSGYRVGLAYVLLRSRELQLARVKQRVAQGGHDIPRDIILRRYDRSLDNLAAAIRLAHETIVYDNTELELIMLIKIDNGRAILDRLDESSPLHARISAAVVDALR